jgi:hypothetical protein
MLLPTTTKAFGLLSAHPASISRAKKVRILIPRCSSTMLTGLAITPTGTSYVSVESQSRLIQRPSPRHCITITAIYLHRPNFFSHRCNFAMIRPRSKSYSQGTIGAKPRKKVDSLGRPVTEKKLSGLKPFQPGESGNPGGSYRSRPFFAAIARCAEMAVDELKISPKDTGAGAVEQTLRFERC